MYGSCQRSAGITPRYASAAALTIARIAVALRHPGTGECSPMAPIYGDGGDVSGTAAVVARRAVTPLTTSSRRADRTRFETQASASPATGSRDGLGSVERLRFPHQDLGGDVVVLRLLEAGRHPAGKRPRSGGRPLLLAASRPVHRGRRPRIRGEPGGPAHGGGRPLRRGGAASVRHRAGRRPVEGCRLRRSARRPRLLDRASRPGAGASDACRAPAGPLDGVR